MFKDPLLWLRMAECCMGLSLDNQALGDLHLNVAGDPLVLVKTSAYICLSQRHADRSVTAL